MYIYKFTVKYYEDEQYHCTKGRICADSFPDAMDKLADYCGEAALYDAQIIFESDGCIIHESTHRSNCEV